MQPALRGGAFFRNINTAAKKNGPPCRKKRRSEIPKCLCGAFDVMQNRDPSPVRSSPSIPASPVPSNADFLLYKYYFNDVNIFFCWIC